MAEQIFRSPGFFEQEIDISAKVGGPTGTPAGILGTSEIGPAFVPVTIGTFQDFMTRFGNTSPDRFGPYAVREFLKHRSAVTYMRVLGAGANKTIADFKTTRDKGTVKNAGFKVEANGSAWPNPDSVQDMRHSGSVQFIVAKHVVSASELTGFPAFSDNDSFRAADGTLAADSTVNLVRGMILFASGTRGMILSGTEQLNMNNSGLTNDLASLRNVSRTHDIDQQSYFKLAISTPTAANFGSAVGQDGGGAAQTFTGIRVVTASLNPTDPNYISKVLNTDPLKFQSEHHLLYADFAVEDELAPVQTVTNGAVALVSGSNSTVSKAGVNARNLYGRFDTRYRAGKSTKFISQPFGDEEHNLFHFELISDGAAMNGQFKISIANLRASTDPSSDYGTFDVQLRRFDDNDYSPEIIENYRECSLNPRSERYVARMIGDKKVQFNFDADTADERRLVVSGKYPNRSHRIRIVMSRAVEEKIIPKKALPFGFRGIPMLKTTETLTDSPARKLSPMTGSASVVDASDGTRFFATRLAAGARQDAGFDSDLGTSVSTSLTGSIVPPMPMRFKVTRGAIKASANTYIGQPGDSEKVDRRLYWGIKTTKLAESGSLSDVSVENPNIGKLANPLVKTYTKFMGIEKMDALVTGSDADLFNNNKFTLARVALNNTDFTQVTNTARNHMKDAAYIRNGVPDATLYKVGDMTKALSRVTLASLIASSSTVFNRFTSYAKFTNIFYGGFDGMNILDKDNYYMNDRATSAASGGKAGSTFTGGMGLNGTDDSSMSGKGRDNNAVHSFAEAIRIMTDDMTVNTNILAIPGMREPNIVDTAADRVREYSKAMYVMDLINYDEDVNRLFLTQHADGSKRPDVKETAEQFDGRGFDNNYVATYFPDVYVFDNPTGRSVKVPASVAALGALGFNDKVSYPWFAPAGFNRGALDFVTNVHVRLSTGDRDVLYDSRINPLATFPGGGFVIFGQKTLQYAKSALDRVNVRRMLLEVKRLVVRVAKRLLFEQNTPATRARFIGQVAPLLGMVQAQAGIEQFRIVMDSTNNSQADVEANKLNGRIVVVPTRAVEFIAIDFIITNSGVSFA